MVDFGAPMKLRYMWFVLSALLTAVSLFMGPSLLGNCYLENRFHNKDEPPYL